MAKYANGNRSLAISDRSGQAFPFQEMVTEWNGSFVHISEYEEKHPQIRRKKAVADAIALQKSRPQKFQQPKTVADNDIVLADSGGISVGVANLTLPGDFAFETFETEVTSNGITTSLQTMQPRDPSLQNRRREASAILGSITVSIS
jgi:TPP-dependent 2-oxoacid decarboxylase|tara:strand:+ start:764 stop:1204 length:441 start_codon:yes stop_codon:yes gene_type:complete